MMIRGEVHAVLFDLGNTLASYYRKEDFRPILEQSLAATRAVLHSLGATAVSADLALVRALAENREARDYRCTPMLDRLSRIFEIPPPLAAAHGGALCRAFLGPIFATGLVYDDAAAVLAALRAHGYRTGIVSNSPWGSPPHEWRQEIDRLGLADKVDAVVLCGDVGWRKPARAIFDEASRRIGVPNRHCAFVGDDLEWDVSGAMAAGMHAVHIDRSGHHAAFHGRRIERLTQLVEWLVSGDVP